ncbi:GNAT family N-acetyltransferase [Candidatus Uabimicrobium amorphum]|uniref:N-acetyltransferase n=1 Tax=Uabimicrobium amorphum TaxID=2596890 RepID=A0A5S9IR24_UABAM|nr:GNAT family protein [Candidatus Uabimicrobium amorphum]BBM86538.1 N-acetyltransferase [Candidatus Uabimicrobium amorphum]
MHYKQLCSSRLLLRKFRANDLDFLFKHFSDANVTKFLYDQEPLSSKKEAQELLSWVMDIDSGDHIRWCITLKDQPIGTCGFHLYDATAQSAEIGYDLAYEHWNKGYMSEVLDVVLNYAKRDLHLRTIKACVAIDNIPSQKLLLKQGFVLVETDPKKHLFRGKYYAHHIYSLALSGNCKFE